MPADPTRALAPRTSDTLLIAGGVVAVLFILLAVLLVSSNSHRLHAAEWTFLALSLLTVSVLFGFLVYDIRQRRSIAQRFADANRDLITTVSVMQRSAAQSRLLIDCSNELQLCVSPDQIYSLTAGCLTRLIPGSSGWLAMLDPITQRLAVVASWGPRPLAPTGSFLPEDCCSIRLGQPRWREAVTSAIHCRHFAADTPSRYLCAPLNAQGETLGIVFIECEDDDVHALLRRRLQRTSQMLQLASMTIAAMNLRNKLEHQAIRDGLTRLFNRHFMEIALERDLAHARRHQTPLAVFMIDVDHFKRFNDTHGHAAGDAMLKAVAHALQANIRTEDTACRYGGEEFAILLPGMPPEVACERAQLLRENIAALNVPLRKGVHANATISVGVSFFPQDATQPSDLLELADQALYAAKQNGRNQIALARAGSPA